MTKCDREGGKNQVLKSEKLIDLYNKPFKKNLMKEIVYKVCDQNSKS